MKPEKANGTRWVDHKLRATSKLIKNWPIIVTQLENYAEDSSNREQDRAKVRGYLRQLKQHKMVWYLAFVKDILNEVSKISLLFQREDLTVYSAMTKLQSAETSLRALIDNDGPSVSEINDKIIDGLLHGFKLQNIPNDALVRDRRRITQSVLDCLNTRLENLSSDEVFLACNAFDHKNWPLSTEREALLQYGIGDIRQIFNHYESVLTNSGCNLVNALSQWSDLKFYVSGNARYSTLHPLLVWQLISQMDRDKGDYKDILKVIHLSNVLPLANASCERAFSTMKRIKSDWRCRLGAEIMDTLMRIKVGDISLKDFDPRPAVRRWWLSGERQKRPNTLPYGPRN